MYAENASIVGGRNVILRRFSQPFHYPRDNVARATLQMQCNVLQSLKKYITRSRAYMFLEGALESTFAGFNSEFKSGNEIDLRPLIYCTDIREWRQLARIFRMLLALVRNCGFLSRIGEII